MMNTFIKSTFSLLLVHDGVAGQPTNVRVPPMPMKDDELKPQLVRDHARGDATVEGHERQRNNDVRSRQGRRPLAGLSEQTQANAEGQQNGTRVTDGDKTTGASTGAPTVAPTAAAQTTTLVPSTTALPTTTLAPVNRAQASNQQSTTIGDDASTALPTTTLAPRIKAQAFNQPTTNNNNNNNNDDVFSSDFLLSLATEEGANLLLGFLEATLGNEAKRLLPKLKPLVPRLQKIVEDIISGSQTPDFSVLKELPAGIIRKLVPALVRGIKDQPLLANVIPEEVLDLFAHDSNVLPQLLESLPEVAPLFYKFTQDSDLGALLDSLLALVQDPRFMKELADMLPHMARATSLGDGIPPEVMELWPEITRTLAEAIPILLREVPQIQDPAVDGMRITEKMIKVVRPLYRRVVKLMELEDNQALVDTTKLVDAVAPIARDLMLIKTKQDFRTLVIRNMGQLVRIPTLFKRALSSIEKYLSEDNDDAAAIGIDVSAATTGEEDYLKCATKCKDKVPKDAFDCEKSPLVVVRCLAACEDNFIAETYIIDLKLFEEYKYCGARSFMFFESPSKGVCKPDVEGAHCKKYLAQMPEKYFEVTTGKNYDEVYGDLVNDDEFAADAKEGSNAGKTFTSGALMLPFFMF